jgi:hypothetical protein
MSGWTLVDKNSNKSLPWTGTNNSAYVTPATEMQDPVGKMRMSTPQSLIDTDFEYGTQPTKWETLSTQQNRPSVYYIAQQPRTVTSIAAVTTSQNTIRVLMADTTGFSVGTPIYIQNSNNASLNGWFLVSAVNTNVSVDYVVTADPIGFTTANQYTSSITDVYLGYFYTFGSIPVSGTLSFTTNGTSTVSVTCGVSHGLSAGSLIYVTGTTSSGTTVNGAQVVLTVPTSRVFTFANTNGVVAAATISNTAGFGNLWPRPAGYVESRPFDGGVAFSEGAAVANSILTRQTRRYFRYQSGKGIQFSTGSCLSPLIFVQSYFVDSASATQEGDIITRFPHNLTVGAVITITGSDVPYANGTFTVSSIYSPNEFYISMPNIPTVFGVTVGGLPAVNVTNWYGSANRLGMFDQQNGMFFEYDGQTLSAVWRSSTTQLTGVSSVTNGSGSVTGSGTSFKSQLATGDFIVIRGQSYRVTGVASNTGLTISPEYRGPTLTRCIVSKTIDVKVPQSQWADRLDGTGPSGYTLDLTKMQMWYIDYSWYGAGFIRWGLRTTKGQIAYVYQQTNNNQRNEAYMRSGNMCARYETNGICPITSLTSSLASATTTGGIMNVADASKFAPSGVVKVFSGSAGITNIEYISYTKLSNTQLTIVARAQTGGNVAAQTFTVSSLSSNPIIAVEYATPDTAPAISHWGSSVIMDGQFNDDKSLIFNYGTTTAITTTNTNPIVLMALRVAPAVDNGTTGLLGVKEIINRMQLQLDSMGLYTTGTGYLINLVLNGYASGAMSGGFIAPVQQVNGITSSLAQIATNTNAVTVTGGESVFAGYTNTSGNSTFDLSGVRDLGNSILGGGTSNTVPTSQSNFYPDGPDILYVVATPLSSTSSTILARISWKEAQA